MKKLDFIKSIESDFNMKRMVGDDTYEVINYAWAAKEAIANDCPNIALDAYYAAPGDITEFLTSDEKVRLLVWDYEREARQ